jgi:hypothetical protein
MSFAKFIASYPGIYLQAYGPNLHLGYPLITLIEYNPKYTLNELKKCFNFDIIIINTKSRCFDYYSPHAKESRGCWLPSDFKSFDCPKIIIEEDYHYETDDKWYQEIGINLILQRHYSQSLRKNVVPMKFFPFSVDIATFNSWKTECIHEGKILPMLYHRQKKLAFVGSTDKKTYFYRNTATDILLERQMAVSFSSCKKINGEYIKVLREYIGYISCGSIFEITAAKNFEIMSSGGVLFTNRFKGIDILFPENAYCSYKNDCSDVIEKASKILNERQYVNELVINSRDCIQTKHTHDIRLKELLVILKGMR